ncbi:MAG: 50S ribosomal protein L17 [Elusimicrobia bacterium]|nr:50S ribosomal protein L17 [Elusimicrobiota bacterium]
MRHGIAGNSFGRNQKWRQATVRDLVRAVISKERIRTTRAKAAEARKVVDKMVTLGKKGTLAARRKAFALLCDHDLVKRLFDEIAPRFENRQGGYTRIIKFALNRPGDNAEMVLLELTERIVAPAETPKVEEAEVVEKKDKGEAKPKKPAAKKVVKKKAAAA